MTLGVPPLVRVAPPPHFLAASQPRAWERYDTIRPMSLGFVATFSKRQAPRHVRCCCIALVQSELPRPAARRVHVDGCAETIDRRSTTTHHLGGRGREFFPTRVHMTGFDGQGVRWPSARVHGAFAAHISLRHLPAHAARRPRASCGPPPGPPRARARVGARSSSASARVVDGSLLELG